MRTHPKAIETLLARSGPDRRLGPFVLLEQLGSGGFAPVWRAHEVFGSTVLRTVAVKLFAPLPVEVGGSERERAIIVQEARALCSIEHPNVVRFHSLPTDGSGVMGLAMEYVAGRSLDERLRAEGRLQVIDALDVGVAIASALTSVHQVGIVHRDVKPANVVDAGGVYKLIDFGIAASETQRPAERGQSRVVVLDDLPLEFPTSPVSALGELATSTAPGVDAPSVIQGILCGTIGYIDPVCIGSGSSATAASDLYSLGAMLFECLSGRVPAAAAAERGKGLSGEVLDGRRAPPSLGALEADVPLAFAQLIDDLLAPAREARPRSAREVLARLTKLRSQVASTAEGSRGPADSLDRAPSRDTHAAQSGEDAGLQSLVERLQNETVALQIERALEVERARLRARVWKGALIFALMVAALVVGYLSLGEPGGQSMGREPVEESAPPVASAAVEPRVDRSKAETVQPIPSMRGAVPMNRAMLRPYPVRGPALCTVEVLVTPENAAVRVDGAPVDADKGHVRVTGEVGTVHSVEAESGALRDSITFPIDNCHKGFAARMARKPIRLQLLPP